MTQEKQFVVAPEAHDAAMLCLIPSLHTMPQCFIYSLWNVMSHGTFSTQLTMVSKVNEYHNIQAGGSSSFRRIETSNQSNT